MRILEYEKSTTSVAYRWMNGVAIVFAALASVVLLLIIGNHLMLKRTDPIHAPALLKLTEQLKSDPQSAQLHEQIRELDFLARHAFFSSQRFQAASIYLLLGSVAACIIAFKTLQVYRQRTPYPTGNPPREDLAENARWARRAITATGLVLIGIALSLAIPWKSPLDQPLESAPIEKLSETRPTPQEFARNWPRFLGAAQAHALSKELPIAWSETNGILWKVPLPKPGNSAPIIWNGRLFLTGGDEERREIYCLDADSGKLLWTHVAIEIQGSPQTPPRVSDEATIAPATMASDGHRVFAIFATGDLLCLDLEGKRVWAKNLGMPNNPFGHASSLAVIGDSLLIQYDQQTNGVFLAVDTKTGASQWKTGRAFDVSWATPLVADISGKTELILAAPPAVASYNFKTGAELWRKDFFQHAEVTCSPVFSNGLVIISADGPGIAAVDVATHAIVWSDQNQAPGVSTPLIIGDLLFAGLDNGGIVCRQLQTGKILWEQETDEGFYASPILAGDRIYLIDRAGLTQIFEAKDKFNLIGRCKIDLTDPSTPAVYENRLYIRGKKFLYCIGS